MQQYGKENLKEPSIEMMVEYIHDMIIPLMIAKENKVPVEEVRGDEERYDKAKKNTETVWSHLHLPIKSVQVVKLLGFTYCPRKKIIMLMGMQSLQQ